VPSTEDFTRHKDLSKFHWRNGGKTGGGDYGKRNALPKMEKTRQIRVGAHYEN
jgi:hypothetical protein